MYLTDPNPKILAKKSELVRKLLSFLPRDAVIDDPHETLAYECDALSAYRLSLIHISEPTRPY